jgi:hypothetical protein
VQWVGIIEHKSNIYENAKNGILRNMLLYIKIQMQQINHTAEGTRSLLSFWHATEPYNTSVLSSNLSMFLVLFGGNSVGQLN